MPQKTPARIAASRPEPSSCIRAACGIGVEFLRRLLRGVVRPRNPRRRPMKYPEQYRTELLKAIQGIDLDGVSAMIDVFREARAHGRRIFVCGCGGSGGAAAHRLSEMVRQSSLNRAMRFHIVALTDELSSGRRIEDDLNAETVFLDQIRNVAQHSDVIVGISVSGNSCALLRAFEYANQVGCRTISIAGKDGGKLAKISRIVVLVPASHAGSVEDAHMIICHMIGDYFVNFDQG